MTVGLIVISISLITLPLLSTYLTHLLSYPSNKNSFRPLFAAMPSESLSRNWSTTKPRPAPKPAQSPLTYLRATGLPPKQNLRNDTDGTNDLSGGDRESREGETRKPWDPPFPTSAPNTHRPRSDPPSPFTIEQAHTAQSRSSIPAEHLSHPQRVYRSPYEAQNEPSGSFTALYATQSTKSRRSLRKTFLAVLYSVALILGIILFIFGFAALIAHCLAAFIVYKTEARLGEARRGIVKGGEMRMCLCAQ